MALDDLHEFPHRSFQRSRNGFLKDGKSNVRDQGNVLLDVTLGEGHVFSHAIFRLFRDEFRVGNLHKRVCLRNISQVTRCGLPQCSFRTLFLSFFRDHSDL